uniref:Cold shock domain containing C2 n=1 Tax=Cyprinus carpio TaxID=7962 RepID=A0A8C1PEB5_CYPCA
MAEPELSSAADPSLRSPRSAPLSLSFPFPREGSRVWERGALQPGQLPSPLPTKRTRTYSATVRANGGPVFKGVCKNFSRSQGHGFIRPYNKNPVKIIFKTVGETLLQEKIQRIKHLKNNKNNLIKYEYNKNDKSIQYNILHILESE